MLARVIETARGRLASTPLATGAAILAAAVASGIAARQNPSEAHPPKRGHRPNVVVVMTDDQAVGDLRVMHRTRRLLARKGVTFRNYFTTFPECCPSRATYLTGQYDHNEGVSTNRCFSDLDQSTTMAVALQRAGYRTGWVGKFLNGYPGFAHDNPEDIPQGFSRWWGETRGLMYKGRVDANGTIKIFRHRYLTNVYADLGARFIRRSAASGSPFWLTVATLAPHGEPKRKGLYPNPRPAPQDRGAFRDAPLPRPPSFNERDVRDKPRFLRYPRLQPDEIRDLRKRYHSRLESLLAVDRLVAKLVRQVRAAHQLRNTWFIFTSDNGFMLGEHRMVGKKKLYEESERVPLIIRGPRGKLPRGAVRRQLTGNVDLAPTILRIAGAAPLDVVDGRSLLPLARDRKAGHGRAILYSNQEAVGVRVPGWVLIEHDQDHDGTPDAFELYDLRRDPYELRNLYRRSLDAKRHPHLAAVRERLAARLAELRSCSGAGCR